MRRNMFGADLFLLMAGVLTACGVSRQTGNGLPDGRTVTQEIRAMNCWHWFFSARLIMDFPER